MIKTEEQYHRAVRMLTLIKEGHWITGSAYVPSFNEGVPWRGCALGLWYSASGRNMADLQNGRDDRQVHQECAQVLGYSDPAHVVHGNDRTNGDIVIRNRLVRAITQWEEHHPTETEPVIDNARTLALV